MRVTTSFVLMVVACCCLAMPTLAFLPSAISPSKKSTQMMAAGRAGQEDTRRSVLSKTLAGGLGALSLTAVTLGGTPMPAAAKGVKRIKNAPSVKLPSVSAPSFPPSLPPSPSPALSSSASRLFYASSFPLSPT